MVCLGCRRLSTAVLCQGCSRSLRPAPERLLPGGIPLIAAFEHHGPAKTLVHHLKYRGVTVYAEVVGEMLAERLPRAALVPIPRVLTRRLKYGVDPARVLALSIARRTGMPVLDALVAPVHSPRRAGRDHSRPVARFRMRSDLRYPVVVVDDVVTTGSTVLAAIEVLSPGLVGAVAAANVVTKVATPTAGMANVVRDGSNVGVE